MTLRQARWIFAVMVATLAIATGCSSGSSTNPVGNNIAETGTDGNGNQVTSVPPTDDQPSPQPDPADPPQANPPETDSNVSSTETGGSTPPASDDPPQSQDPILPSIPATDIDLSAGDDDSPTSAESLSLQGPFIKDTSRPYGPPSAPEALTLLLSADNWIEFTWAPSTDDQSVEAYEIYRDGQLLHTVRGDTGYEFDYRRWLSTSTMDCDYTHYTECRDTQPSVGSQHEYSVVAVDNEGMRSSPSRTAVFQFQVPGNQPVNLTGYRSVFAEEYNGNQLDRNRWKTALPWGPQTSINGELQYFVNRFGSNPLDYDPFVFTGSTLQITGIATPPELLTAANNQPYLSGVVTTADHFSMTYGYVEMRARLAGGSGLLSTFYLFNQDFEKNKPEIDIIEYIGSRPDKAYQTYHYYDSNRARYGSGEKHSSPTMETLTGTDLSADFHEYAVLWEPGLVIWYIDGSEVRRLSGPRVSDEPMNIIAHLVIGSSWIGAPDASSVPTVFEIDYIRAWQR